jgi:CheY-like chemotaxis protein
MAQVLVAEDEVFTALEVVDRLAELGHTVKDAADGAIAMALLESFEPDVVVTDLTMPNVDGYELIRRLRNRPGRPIPVILITAVPEGRLPSDLAYDGYLGKPVNYDLLASMVARLLSSRDTTH